MLTQITRRMERDGLLIRIAYRVVPPKVDYRLTGLGLTLGATFCGVRVWASENSARLGRRVKLSMTTVRGRRQPLLT
jgi:DNA-binding HxlR family transcriptional regulator